MLLLSSSPQTIRLHLDFENVANLSTCDMVRLGSITLFRALTFQSCDGDSVRDSFPFSLSVLVAVTFVAEDFQDHYFCLSRECNSTTCQFLFTNIILRDDFMNKIPWTPPEPESRRSRGPQSHVK